MPEQPIVIRKKKVHAAHAHHGGSWKVAYADFVTAMMAFFMVMWILGLSAETKALIQGYFNDPLGFAKTTPRSKAVLSLPGASGVRFSRSRSKGESAQAVEEREMMRIESDLKRALGNAPDLKALLKDVTIVETPEGLLIELIERTGTVFFDSGRATIRPDGAHLIARLAPILAASGRKMAIEGHTDAAPYAGSGYNNWDLSTDRALALRRALASGGVSDRQFTAVHGYAATRLKYPERPTDPANRRVSILLPKLYSTSGGAPLPADEARDARSEPAVDVRIRPEATSLAGQRDR